MGKVDYMAAWEKETYPENMATDENGYRLIVQHLGSREGCVARPGSGYLPETGACRIGSE